MKAQQFAADIKNHKVKFNIQSKKVLSTSVQEMLRKAQTTQPSVKVTGGSFEEGKIPVDTGNLVNSLVSEVDGSPVATGSDSYIIAANRAKVGQRLTFRWVAKYAKRIEFGFTGTDSAGRSYNQAGRFFVTRAIQAWPSIVRKNILKFGVK